MTKYLIFLIILNFFIIKADPDEIDIMFKGKCEDTKSKIGACMYVLNDYDSKHNDKIALFDKCGKKEKCNYDYKMCTKVPQIKKRKTDESCNYNEDCISNLCESNKCSVVKGGNNCEGEIQCESGYTCYRSYSTNGISYKCVKLAKEGDKADDTYCMSGLGISKDNKCAKYGTIDHNGEIEYGSSELICKSSYYHQKKDDPNKYICDTIDTEPECDENGLKKEGKWSDGSPLYANDCTENEDYTGSKKYYSKKYSKVRAKLFSKFLEDYKDLDLDKLNSDEYESWEDGMKCETKEKWQLFQYASDLEAAGIINSEGEVIEDKKCEYEFLMKNYLHSNFIRLNVIIIAMFALLFF